MCINNKILPYLLQLQGELAVFHSIIAGIQSNHLSLARHVHSCSHARFAESTICVPVTLVETVGLEQVKTLQQLQARKLNVYGAVSLMRSVLSTNLRGLVQVKYDI